MVINSGDSWWNINRTINTRPISPPIVAVADELLRAGTWDGSGTGTRGEWATTEVVIIVEALLHDASCLVERAGITEQPAEGGTSMKRFQINIHDAFGICHRNSSIMGRPFHSLAFSVRPQIPLVGDGMNASHLPLLSEGTLSGKRIYLISCNCPCGTRRCHQKEFLSTTFFHYRLLYRISWILMMMVMVTDLIKRLLSLLITFSFNYYSNPKYSWENRFDIFHSIFLWKTKAFHNFFDTLWTRGQQLSTRITFFKALINKCHQVGLLNVVNLDWITNSSLQLSDGLIPSWWGDQSHTFHLQTKHLLSMWCAIYKFTSWDVIKVIRSIKWGSLRWLQRPDHCRPLNTLGQRHKMIETIAMDELGGKEWNTEQEKPQAEAATTRRTTQQGSFEYIAGRGEHRVGGIIFSRLTYRIRSIK